MAGIPASIADKVMPVNEEQLGRGKKRGPYKKHLLEEMIYNTLSIINENEGYSVVPGSCLNEECVRLQAEVHDLRAENEHLKAQLAIQHLEAALSALTSSRNLTDTAASKICSSSRNLTDTAASKICSSSRNLTDTAASNLCSQSFTVQKTAMQLLVKDSNDPSRFRGVLVPKRELNKLLDEAKSARNSAVFLLNGVSRILFSPKELASAKGLTKARAGTAALDEEKVDALFEFMKCVCKANGWPSLDYRTIRRNLAVKICNARRGLKKAQTIETNHEDVGLC